MARQSKTSSTSRKAESPKKAKKEASNKETSKKETSKKETSKSGSAQAPKKPRSAYILFSTDERQKLKTEKESAQLDNKQVMGELANRWNKASEKVKAKYDKMAQQDKER